MHSRAPTNHQSDHDVDIELKPTSYASPAIIMRTFEDTFSGEKIYPGKVCLPLTHIAPSNPPPHCVKSRKSPSICTGLTSYMHADLAGKNVAQCADVYDLIGKTLRPRRQQDLPIPKRQDRIPLPPTQEPSSHRMDYVVSKTA